jgi:F0F1-type ATP synthase assembly protein I
MSRVIVLTLRAKNSMNSRKDDNRGRFQQLGLLTAGLVFPVSIVIGYAMGYFLDRWLGTTFLKIVFLLFGIAAGFVSFYRTIIQAEKDQ